MDGTLDSHKEPEMYTHVLFAFVRFISSTLDGFKNKKTIKLSCYKLNWILKAFNSYLIQSLGDTRTMPTGHLSLSLSLSLSL